jgi:multidrug efflux pump subunit AcrA (membrane-fusion protein)
MPSLRFALNLGLTLCAVLPLGACSRDKAESKAPPALPPVPVAVATVEQKTMALQLQAIGTVRANRDVHKQAIQFVAGCGARVS